ncbi:hypothetical protein, partial [Methyloceanibacter sp.]|uniref:hypothetical protein n=1 Tax=Methyloceanibacter sp. TaxID=1965321 RepID=UPI002D23ED2D|nr:hypothetical protein [Methyloceanibacter sp.]
WWKPMKTLLLAIAALIGMTSFADAQPPCAPFPWCASGNWLDKHCWCYRYRGPQWGYDWGNDGGWNDDGGWWRDDGNGKKHGKHKHHKHHDD